MIIFHNNSLADAEQQQTLYTNEANASLFTTDTSTQCAFNITPSNLETDSVEDINDTPQNNTSIHFYSKHKYRHTFGDAHIQYHDFDNGVCIGLQRQIHSIITTRVTKPLLVFA